MNPYNIKKVQYYNSYIQELQQVKACLVSTIRQNNSHLLINSAMLLVLCHYSLQPLLKSQATIFSEDENINYVLPFFKFSDHYF